MEKRPSILSPFFYIESIVRLRFRRAGMKRKLFEDETFIVDYWDNEKNKPVLILIQAFAAESQYSWHEQVRLLSKHFRLIIPNTLYFGRSTMKTAKSYSLAVQLQAIEALVDDLEIDSLTLCGSSIGGVIAAEFASIHPHKVEKLILINCPLKFDVDAHMQSILDEFSLQTKADLLVPQSAFDLHRLFSLAYYKKPPLPRFVFKSIHKYLYRKTEDKIKLVNASGNELQKLQGRAYSFSFPVLLIWGALDRLCPINYGQQLVQYLGENAELRVIQKTAHMPHIERPKQVNKVIKTFLLA